MQGGEWIRRKATCRAWAKGWLSLDRHRDTAKDDGVFKRALQYLKSSLKRRIFVVAGEQWRKFDEPYYSTDPRTYNFDPAGCETKSPDEFLSPPWDSAPGTQGQRGPAIMKAFRVASDAIDFACCCNLANVVLVAYDRQDGKWVRSADQSDLDCDW